MGLAVASPYVGMVQKQDGCSNQCISVYTVIPSLRKKMLASKSTLKQLIYAAPVYSSTKSVQCLGRPPVQVAYLKWSKSKIVQLLKQNYSLR